MTLPDWKLNGTALSPYNFSIDEGYEVIGEDRRVLNGAMRRDVVARKRTFAMSWEFLQEIWDGTYHGYADLMSLGTKAGTMTFQRPVGTAGTQVFNVFIDPPEASHRWRYDGSNVYWDVGLMVREQ